MIMGFGVEGAWGFVLFAGNGPWCIVEVAREEEGGVSDEG